MKNLLRALCTITATLCATVAVAMAQEHEGRIELSPRVGDSIDADEGRYFCLFEGHGDFAWATVSPAPGDRMSVYLHRVGAGSATDTTIFCSTQAIKMLGRYIDIFETLFDGAALASIDWPMLRDLVRPAAPYVEDARPLIVEATRHRTIEGIVVYADSTLLILGPSSLLKQPADLLGSSVLLLPAEIIRVRDDRGILEHLFDELDLPVMRNDTAYWRLVLPQLRGRTLVAGTPSPELRRLIVAKRAASGGPSPFAGSLKEVEARIAPPRFHVSVMRGVFQSLPDVNYMRTISYRDPFPHEEKHAVAVLAPSESQWEFALEYSLFTHLRLGAHFIMGGGYAAADSEYERYRCDAIELGGHAVAINPGVFGINFVDRMEATIGAALVLGLVHGDGRITTPVDPYHGRGFSDAPVAVGGVVSIGCGYYPTSNVSINVEGRVTTSLSATVPTRQHSGVLTFTQVTITHEAYQVSPTGASILAGIGLHF